MEQIATLEINNTTFKVTVGYLLNDRVNIIYRKVFPLTTTIYDSDIYDFNTLAKDLSVIQHIEENNLRICIKEVILIYPPFGLDVYTSSGTIKTLSMDSRVSLLDVQNCLSIISRERLPKINSVLIDVIPTVFELDNRRSFFDVPLNEQSATLSIKANMYTLPQKVVENLKKALKLAKIKIKKEVIAPCGVAYLVNSLKRYSPNYLLVNFGERISTISVVSDNQVVASTYFPFGKGHLLDRIVSMYNITYKEADELLNIYGIDDRQSSYHPHIYKYQNTPNKGFNKNELLATELPFFNEWIDYLNNAIRSLIQNENILHNVEVVLTGDGALIKGLRSFIRNNYLNNDNIKILRTDVIGCDDPLWANSVGAIYFSTHYKGSKIDNNIHNINELTRTNVIDNTRYTEVSDNL